MATTNKRFRKIIYILSFALPIIIALLLVVKIPGYNLSFLPPIYASINALTAFLLILALVAVKRKNIQLHKRLIQTCMGLSILFFIGYIAYHSTSDPTILGDLNGNRVLDPSEKALLSPTLRLFYFLILITHIMLSVTVVPLVLFSYLFALEGKFDKHKKWVRFTWPIWFYVAVSGVVVYWLISPYYLN